MQVMINIQRVANIHVVINFRSTVVERATHVHVYAGSNPTSADHR